MESRCPPRLNIYRTFFHELKQLANYPLLAPRPPRFDSVALFNVGGVLRYLS